MTPDLVLRFVRNLYLTGDFAGTKFVPRPWQEDIYRRLFATDKAGKLIVKDSFLLFPRKIGKTYVCGTCVVTGLFLFGRGQPIIAVAASQKQAGHLFAQVKSIIEQDPFLAKQCKILKDRITHLPSGSYFVAVPANGDAGHGHPSPAMIIIDEYHAWKQKRHRDTYTALTTGSAARLKNSPIVIKISSQTTDLYTLAGEEFAFCQKLKGRIHNGKVIKTGEISRPDYLAVLYYLPSDAKWENEKLWYEVSPGLGDYLSIEEYRKQFLDAVQFPSRANNFKVFFLNMPCDSVERWMPSEPWSSCKVPYKAADLENKLAIGGLDIAPVNDLSSFVWIVPDGDKVKVLQQSWLNRVTFEERKRNEQVPWKEWEEKGYVKITPGNTTCTKTIAADVIDICKKFRVKLIAADQMHAFETAQTIQDAGQKIEWWRPYFQFMGPPTAKLQKMVLEKSIQHNGDPLLAWCMSNVRVETDKHGNQRPTNDLRLRHESVDAAVSLIMAVGAWMKEGAVKESGYAVFAKKRREAELTKKAEAEKAALSAK